MLPGWWRVGLWSAVYLLLATVPLGLVPLRQASEHRGFWLEFGVGLGLVGFAMLGLQFVTTARFRWIAPHFGSDAIIYFHRRVGILVLLVVLAHPLVLFVVDPTYLEYLDPRVNFLRALFLTAATISLVLVVALPLWGLRFGLSYEWWRLTHGLLAAGVIVVGLVHALQVGHYVSGFLGQLTWVLATLVFLSLLIHARVIKPLRTRRTPYRVVEVIPEQGDVHVLVLEAEDHPGMSFRPGQYAWLTLGDTPFALQQHPFSFASSSQSTRRIEFAIKETGDFTATIKDIALGTRAYLEGPYGSFVLDPNAEAAVFVAGGIGITPALSILRSARDRDDRRPFILFYGNINQAEISFRDEMDLLAAQLDLQVVHVLSEPDRDWTGETGFITKEIMDRYLAPVEDKDVQYFVCGPTPMMDTVEQELLAIGVPGYRLLSERFDFI
jgi:predicted ferric reductase